MPSGSVSTQPSRAGSTQPSGSGSAHPSHAAGSTQLSGSGSVHPSHAAGSTQPSHAGTPSADAGFSSSRVTPGTVDVESYFSNANKKKMRVSTTLKD